MNIKNGQVIIYEVDKTYLQYLSKFDYKVSLKSNRRYTGIIVSENGLDYCIPLTCRVKNRNSKLTIDIKDSGNVTIAQLTLNNMIPVNEKLLKIVDISIDKDKDYLNKELQFLRSDNIVNRLLKKLEKIFKVLENPKHPDYIFFKKLCVDYTLLEKKCEEYTKKITKP